MRSGPPDRASGSPGDGIGVGINPWSNSYSCKCTQTRTPTESVDWGILPSGSYEWDVYVYHGCLCADACTPQGRASDFNIP
jgi:hypothetical protein